MEVVLVEAAQEASEARLDVWAVEERADLEALQPSAQILLWTRLDVLAELLADHLDVVEDERIPNLELPQQFPEYVGGLVPLEGELGPQGVVGRLRVNFHELDEQMPAHLVLHWGILLLQHDKELRGPEYPDPSRHLFGICAHVADNLLLLLVLPRSQEPEDAWNDEASFVEAESCGEEEALQRVEQALRAWSALVDRFVELRVAQPDIRVPLVELGDGVH